MSQANPAQNKKLTALPEPNVKASFVTCVPSGYSGSGDANITDNKARVKLAAYKPWTHKASAHGTVALTTNGEPVPTPLPDLYLTSLDLVGGANSFTPYLPKHLTQTVRNRKNKGSLISSDTYVSLLNESGTVNVIYNSLTMPTDNMMGPRGYKSDMLLHFNQRAHDEASDNSVDIPLRVIKGDKPGVNDAILSLVGVMARRHWAHFMDDKQNKRLAAVIERGEEWDASQWEEILNIPVLSLALKFVVGIDLTSKRTKKLSNGYPNLLESVTASKKVIDFLLNLMMQSEGELPPEVGAVHAYRSRLSSFNWARVGIDYEPLGIKSKYDVIYEADAPPVVVRGRSNIVGYMIQLDAANIVFRDTPPLTLGTALLYASRVKEAGLAWKML